MGGNRVGPRGCSFSGFTQPGDIHTAFDIPKGVNAEDWLSMRFATCLSPTLSKRTDSRAEIAKPSTSFSLTRAHQQKTSTRSKTSTSSRRASTTSLQPPSAPQHDRSLLERRRWDQEPDGKMVS